MVLRVVSQGEGHCKREREGLRKGRSEKGNMLYESLILANKISLKLKVFEQKFSYFFFVCVCEIFLCYFDIYLRNKETIIYKSNICQSIKHNRYQNHILLA